MPASNLAHSLAILLAQILLPHPSRAANETAAGLAWPNALYVPMGGFNAPGSAVSSYYTWSPQPVIPTEDLSAAYDVPFDFIPMLWGCSDDDVSSFSHAVNCNFWDAHLTSQQDVLGFNEPDLAGQADCSPEQAAEVWKSTLEPLKQKGYRLGSPAVTGGPDGKQWMQRWFEVCDRGCNPDFIAVHWYDVDARDFIEHLQDYYWTFGRPIWVTEYAVTNFTQVDPDNMTNSTQASLPQIQLFMDVTRSYMESVDWVERYFWFGAMYDMQGVNPLNSLFDRSGRDKRTGALSALGVQYARVNGSVEVTGTQVAQPAGADRRQRPVGRWLEVIALSSFVSTWFIAEG